MKYISERSEIEFELLNFTQHGKSIKCEVKTKVSSSIGPYKQKNNRRTTNRKHSKL